MKIYLDNSATTRVDKEVAKEINKFMIEKYGNASSLHQLGREAKEEIDRARSEILSFINGKGKIIFTSGGTEANNLAIKGLVSEKKHIITSKIEHPAIFETCKELEKQGYKIDYISVNKEGIVDLEEIKKKISKDTLLVSIMHVNNEIGTIQPIEEIGRICREKGVYFHTDAVQSFGKLDIDAEKMNIDLMSVSGHKINCAKGIGFLYIREGIKIRSILNGGGQEFGLRSGTENVPGIAGLRKAVEISKKKMKDKDKIKKLRDKLISEMLMIKGTRLNGSREKRIFSNVNISFEGIEGESLVLLLDKNGIACSTGSACSSHSLKASHVLKALGLEDLQAHGSLRFSLGWDNNSEEIDYTIKKIKENVNKLREISSGIKL